MDDGGRVVALAGNDYCPLQILAEFLRSDGPGKELQGCGGTDPDDGPVPCEGDCGGRVGFQSPDNEVIVISSCETIGEGIDTKNANMCVFVDPKSSHVKIIQNIGRIVRKQFGVDKPNSTILIPCWVDREKYLDCGGDREKCDEVIREDMSAEGGNFNGILNVMSALKQEDEDLYDICLHYPDTFSPQEIRSNLEKHGFRIGEVVGDGGIVETMENVLDTDIDYEEYDDCDT
ncbi:MAG: hypothetical protein EBY17_12255, partial [Acidobacteriia bacterium]|nr:hypothetical protein [Terriglobia bacterium]